ncbi:MAG TPA: tetratricopeptide repeat protein [Phycisphaerae bacterium]|nr:tetratricopeptide repeat protein [Phycisphaerae bacterium]
MRNVTFALACLLSLAGCQWGKSPETAGYQTVAADPHRDTAAAQKLNAEAVKLIQDHHIDDAEKRLKAALAADLFFGPAHNNLGLVYFHQKKHYLAAWEFQYAAKLMPGKAEPRNNLGLVFEAVGKLDEAMESYEKALALEPESVDVAANLARAYVRKGRKDDKTRKLLGDVVMKDNRPDWIAWAREQLALMGTPPPTTQPTGE